MARIRPLRTIALFLTLLLAVSASAHASCSNEEMQFLQQMTNRYMYALAQLNLPELQRLELEAQQRLSPSCLAALRYNQQMQQRQYGVTQSPRNFYEGSGGAIYGPGVGCDGSGCYAFD